MLSENLKRIRKDNNLSQEQLAEKLGVSRQSVSKWENGEAYPEMDKVLQLCKMFNLNIDELLNQDIKDKTLSNLEEVKSRGAKTIVVSNEKIDGYDLEVVVPKLSSYFQPILVVPCLQLIAYEVARLRGCDIDKPKNLAKSVTVE